jgi:ABC-type sugar transport system permease subunit
LYQSSRRKLIVPFLLPAVVLIFIFYLLPAIQTAYVSLTDWYGTFQTTGFKGIDNYVKLFSDKLFLGSIQHTFAYFFISLILLFPISILIAVALQTVKRGKRLIQFMIFAPVVLSVVVAAVMWKFIYNPNIGIINEVLGAIGLESWARPWLGDKTTALTCIIIAAIWHGIGTWIMLLTAGLSRIPQDLHEAARIDGANEGQIFFKITLPLLWDVLQTLIVLWFVQSMQSFSFIYIMTQGGPQGTTEVMGSYLYKMAFEGKMFAYGSAMSIVMAILIIVFSFIGNKLMKREVVQF